MESSVPPERLEPMQPLPSTEADDKVWRDIFTGQDPGLKFMRGLFSRIPSNPRCKMCASPFGGVGGGVMRLLWHAPMPRNPLLCRACSSMFKRHPGGAEIQVSVLFADVRGSTGLAEEISPAAFRNRLQAFYGIAWDAITGQDGIVDKYLGDGVMALFIPGITGELHAACAIAAGRDLIDGMARLPEPRLPVGAGVHSGAAYVGVVGNASEHDFSALGDVVNVAARLGSVAGAGELLVSADSAAAAGLAVDGAPRDRLELKGRRESLEVVRL